MLFFLIVARIKTKVGQSKSDNVSNLPVITCMRTVTSKGNLPKRSRSRDHNMISCPELFLSEAISFKAANHPSILNPIWEIR